MDFDRRTSLFIGYIANNNNNNNNNVYNFESKQNQMKWNRMKTNEK